MTNFCKSKMGLVQSVKNKSPLAWTTAILPAKCEGCFVEDVIPGWEACETQF